MPPCLSGPYFICCACAACSLYFQHKFHAGRDGTRCVNCTHLAKVTYIWEKIFQGALTSFPPSREQGSSMSWLVSLPDVCAEWQITALCAVWYGLLGDYRARMALNRILLISWAGAFRVITDDIVLWRYTSTGNPPVPIVLIHRATGFTITGSSPPSHLHRHLWVFVLLKLGSDY